MVKTVNVTEEIISNKMARIIAEMVTDAMEKNCSSDMAMSLILLGGIISDELNKAIFNEK